jgi:hypothetical protein
MAACPEIKDLGDVDSELNRLRDLVRIIYASVTSNERSFGDIQSGLLWMISDIEDDIDRILAGIQKMWEAST